MQADHDGPVFMPVPGVPRRRCRGGAGAAQPARSRAPSAGWGGSQLGTAPSHPTPSSAGPFPSCTRPPPCCLSLAPGQAHEVSLAPAQPERLPNAPDGSRPTVTTRPTRCASRCQHRARPAVRASNRASMCCPDWIHQHRNQIERLWSGLKEWRAVAIRCPKLAASCTSVLCIAATMDWIRP